MSDVARVLMTADAVGGVWHYALQLSGLLAARGTSVLLATMGPAPSAAQRRDAEAIPGVRLESAGFALEWMPSAWRDVDAAGEWLLRLEEQFEPDVVHLNGFCHGALPWQAPTLVVGHSCVLSWWDSVHGTAAPDEWHEYARRVAVGLQHAGAVAAPSGAMRDALVRFYGARHVRVIPNCRGPRGWFPREKEPFVFAAGRVWDPAKNLALLDCVGMQLSWPIYVAGDTTGPGVESRELRHVQLLGRLPSAETADVMGRASIYAFPARYEPFGLSVLEAALCECALVLGDIPSLRENWGGVARFVHPERPDELRDVVAELIENPQQRRALGSAARRRALSFSPERHLAAYEALYQEMVRAHGRVADSARAY